MKNNLKNHKKENFKCSIGNCTKKFQKLIYIFIGIILLLTGNTVKAFEENTSVVFQAREVYREIIYNGNPLEIPIASCNDFVNIIPIYALDYEETYQVNPSVGFYTYVNIIVENDAVRNALLLGYPNRTVEQLNLTDTKEAYLITQLAVLDTYYHYDLEKFAITKESKYPNFLSHLTNFIQQVRSSSSKKIIPELTIDELQQNWNQEEENYQSKTYQILSNMPLQEYSVEILTNQKENIQVLNENNEFQTQFLDGEKFKILVLEDQDVEFEIQVNATFFTNPVKMGKSPGNEWVSYVLLGKTERKQVSLVDYYQTNQKEQEKQETDKEENIPTESDKTIQKEICKHIETPKREIKKLPQTGF